MTSYRDCTEEQGQHQKGHGESAVHVAKQFHGAPQLMEREECTQII